MQEEDECGEGNIQGNKSQFRKEHNPDHATVGEEDFVQGIEKTMTNQEVNMQQVNTRSLEVGDDRTISKEGYKQNSVKTWRLQAEYLRNLNIERMATYIMENEALKIINEAYEKVFQGRRSIKEEVEIQNGDRQNKGTVDRQNEGITGGNTADQQNNFKVPSLEDGHK